MKDGDKTKAELSQKVATLSFFAMVSVVFIHSRAIGTVGDVPEWCIFLQTLATRSLTCWAVPFFFAVSGFFFARGGYVSGSSMDYWRFLAKKFWTLFVPYLLWGVLGSLFVIPAVMFNNHTTGHDLWERTFIGSENVWEMVNRLFGITTHGPMGNMALWYLRGLIIFFLMAPLFKWIYRFKWLLLAVALGLVFMGGQAWMPLVELRYNSPGWFLMGMCVARFKWEELSCSRLVWALLCIVYVGVALAICGIQAVAGVADGLRQVDLLVPYVSTSGVVAWWFAYDYWLAGYEWKWCKHTFWIYAMHGSIMVYFLSGGYYLIGKSASSAMVLLLLSPPLAIGSCLIVQKGLALLFPRMVTVLTGGRS